MMANLSGMVSQLYIGGVPSPAELAYFEQLGVCYWVNVGGVDIHTMYAYELSFVKSLEQFFFTDIFSPYKYYKFYKPYKTASNHWSVKSDLIETSQPALYEKHTTPHEREQFLKATYTVFEQLRHQQPTHLFCYTGQGRSPTVALAALYWLTVESLPNLTNTIRQRCPQARLTAMSVAAAQWSYHQYTAKTN